MASCAVCLKNKAQYACSHTCHTLYCSPVCAKIDWSKQQHYLACGDFLDELPLTALVEVLSNLSFQDVYQSALISKKFAFVINTYSFRKAFALKHEGEWEERVDNWLWEHDDQIELLQKWIPVLLETKVWDPTFEENSAINHLSSLGLINLVKLLLDDLRVDPAESRALYWATSHPDIVKLLLADPRIDPAIYDDDAAFYNAFDNDTTEVVSIFLQDKRVDPGALENYAIIIQSSYGKIDFVKLLLQDKRVDPGARRNLALTNAIAFGRFEVAKLLLADPRVDPRNSDALNFSVSENRIEFAKLLLQDARVDPFTFLQIAMIRGDSNVIKLLKEVIYQRYGGGDGNAESKKKRLKLGEKIKVQN